MRHHPAFPHEVSASRQVHAGEIIIAEGDTNPTHAYLIRSGHMEVFTRIGDMDVMLATLGPGEVVGEMAILFNEPRNASVRAVTECEVTVLDRETVIKGYNDASPGIRGIMTAMAQRIRRANARLTHAARNSFKIDKPED